MSVITVTPTDAEHLIMRAHLLNVFHRDAATHTDAALNTAVVDAIAKYVGNVASLRRVVKRRAPKTVARTASLKQLRIYTQPKQIAQAGDFSAALQRLAGSATKETNGYGPRTVILFSTMCIRAKDDLDALLLLKPGSCLPPSLLDDDVDGDDESRFLTTIAEEVDNMSYIPDTHDDMIDLQKDADYVDEEEAEDADAEGRKENVSDSVDDDENEEEKDAGVTMEKDDVVPPPSPIQSYPRNTITTTFLEPRLISLADLHDADQDDE